MFKIIVFVALYSAHGLPVDQVGQQSLSVSSEAKMRRASVAKGSSAFPQESTNSDHQKTSENDHQDDKSNATLNKIDEIYKGDQHQSTMTSKEPLPVSGKGKEDSSIGNDAQETHYAGDVMNEAKASEKVEGEDATLSHEPPEASDEEIPGRLLLVKRDGSNPFEKKSCMEKNSGNLCKCVLAGYKEHCAGDAVDVTKDKAKCVADSAINIKTLGTLASNADKNKKGCDFIKSTVYCTNQVGCIEDLADTCKQYKETNKDCDVDCSDANPTAILGTTILFLAALMQI